MSTRKQIEGLTEALDDVPLTDGDARDAVARLGIDVPVWAAEVRAQIALSPADHDLELLLHSAPESVKNAFFDLDAAQYFQGCDVALRKADWCEAQARGACEYDAGIYREAARLLRAAAPRLPGACAARGGAARGRRLQPVGG